MKQSGSESRVRTSRPVFANDEERKAARIIKMKAWVASNPGYWKQFYADNREKRMQQAKVRNARTKLKEKQYDSKCKNEGVTNSIR